MLMSALLLYLLSAALVSFLEVLPTLTGPFSLISLRRTLHSHLPEAIVTDKENHFVTDATDLSSSVGRYVGVFLGVANSTTK